MIEFFAGWALLLLLIYWLKRFQWWHLLVPAAAIAIGVRVLLY